MFDAIPEVNGQIKEKGKYIDLLKKKREILKDEKSICEGEIKKYEQLLSATAPSDDSTNFNSISKKMIALCDDSDLLIALSKDILEMNSLQENIPDHNFVEELKKETRKMRFTIPWMKILSLFANKRAQKYEDLKHKYEKNRRSLDDIFRLKKKLIVLKDRCEKQFNQKYPNKDGCPDEDCLELENKLYKMLENQYLTYFKDQEISKSKRKISAINEDVYSIYIWSQKARIGLNKAKIKNLNTEMYIVIGQRERAYEQRRNISKSIDGHKRNIDKIQKAIVSEIIDDADLIASTVISSCHAYLNGVEFDVMIMDEASQVASFMSLLPLSKCKKFILVGDNKQLQPIEEENISKEMNVSIFNRLNELYPDASTLLQTQYRMNSEISQIASEIFYDGELLTSEESANRILSLEGCDNHFLNPKIPVMFIDTSNVDYYDDEIGYGCSNLGEARYVAHIVSLFTNAGIKTEDIGVVTPYRDQRCLIKKTLEDNDINDQQVDTVHKFQGREKDVIIMSFTKSKKYSFPLEKLRFIENATLINVAITRARKKLILIGNSNTLARSELLNLIFTKIGVKNTIIL